MGRHHRAINARQAHGWSRPRLRCTDRRFAWVLVLSLVVVLPWPPTLYMWIVMPSARRSASAQNGHHVMRLKFNNSLSQFRSPALWTADGQSMQGWQPIHRAARNGLPGLVEKWARRKDVDTQTAAGDTAAHIAARYGRVEVIKLLALKHHTNLSRLNRDGLTPLAVAAQAGHASILDVLVDTGLELDLHSGTFPPAYVAAEAGHVEVVQSLARAGVNMSLAQVKGWTAASVAALRGHAAVVSELGRAGVNLRCYTQSEEGGFADPAWLAALNNHASVVDTLAEHIDLDAVTHPQNGWTPAHLAVEKGYIDIIRALARHNVDLNRATTDSFTPLHRAAYIGNVEVVRVLLDCGVALDKRTYDGATAVFVAAQHKHPDIIKVLAERGADLDLTKYDGATPVSVAAQSGHEDVIQILASYGADLESLTDGTYAPIHLAAYYGHAVVVDTIADAGGNLDKQTPEGWTPAHIAAQRGHGDFIMALFQRGANINRQSHGGTTVANLASQFGHSHVLDRLAEAGVNIHGATYTDLTANMAATPQGTATVLQTFARGKQAHSDINYNPANSVSHSELVVQSKVESDDDFRDPLMQEASATLKLEDGSTNSRRADGRSSVRLLDLAETANLRRAPWNTRRWFSLGCFAVFVAIMLTSATSLVSHCLQKRAGLVEFVEHREIDHDADAVDGESVAARKVSTAASPANPTLMRHRAHAMARRTKIVQGKDVDEDWTITNVHPKYDEVLPQDGDVCREYDVLASTNTKLRSEVDSCRAMKEAAERKLDVITAKYELSIKGLRTEVLDAHQLANNAQVRAQEAELHAEELGRKVTELRSTGDSERTRLMCLLNQARQRVVRLEGERSHFDAARALCELNVGRLSCETLSRIEAALPRLQLSVTREILRREMRESETQMVTGESFDPSSECIVCLAGSREVAFDCGHLCACNSCANNLSLCPVCRVPITERRRIFSS